MLERAECSVKYMCAEPGSPALPAMLGRRSKAKLSGARPIPERALTCGRPCRPWYEREVDLNGAAADSPPVFASNLFQPVRYRRNRDLLLAPGLSIHALDSL